MRTISQIVDAGMVTNEVDETLAKIRETLNTPITPNFFSMGYFCRIVKKYMACMNHILAGGKVGRQLKEMILLPYLHEKIVITVKWRMPLK